MIALIATVLNEGQTIHRLLRSMVAQTRQPDEVVIVDGGSRDDTVAVIQSYADRLPLRVLVEPGCNISVGRNRAITAAHSEIIAVTDAGVELAADWLEKITRPLLENPECKLVGGFFEADYNNLFELAMSATVLPLAAEINPTTFLPSSRSVAFRKEVWQAVGGYPEWLDYCEDLVFDLRMKEVISRQSSVIGRKRTAPPSTTDLATGNWQMATITVVPTARVAFRPRASLRAFFKQYYQYARGDGKADLWRKRHAARYLTYLAALPVIVALGLAVHPAFWALLLPGAFIYLRQPYHRLFHLMRRSTSPPTQHPALSTPPTSIFTQHPALSTQYSTLGTRHSVLGTSFLVLLVPVIRLVGDVAKMLGYPVGWAWRLRHHPPDWKSTDT